MKPALLFLLCAIATLVRGESQTATIIERTKMELTRGKGTIDLKRGTKVEVISQEGGMLGVVYRSVTGLVPAAKTDFKGEVPKGSAPQPAKADASPKPAEVPKAATPSPKPVEAKPSAEKSSLSPSETPTTNYGKMVKKARDNEASHKENLVEPTNENVSAAK